jgi:hypothetical protein
LTAPLSSGHARFLRVPFVRQALRVSGLPAAAGDLPLLVTVHRCESSVLFGHARMVRVIEPARAIGIAGSVQRGRLY